MVNNIIIGIVLLILAALLIKKRLYAFTVLSIISYCCLPVVRYGSDFNQAIGAAYPLTFLIAVGALFYRFAAGKKFSKTQWLYACFTAMVILLMCIGWTFGKKFEFSGIVTLISTAVNALGVISIAYFLSLLDTNKRRNSMLTGVTCVAAVNFIFSIIQYCDYKVGYNLTYMFYATPSRSGPLRTVAAEGIFYRAYGAAYSPLLSGCLLLICVAFILGTILKTEKNSVLYGVILFSVTVTGLILLSKTFILGSLAITIAAVIAALVFVKDKKEKLKKAIILIVAVSLAFISVKAVTYNTRIEGFVNYYYAFITKPFSALLTRYGGITNPSDDPSEPSTAEPSTTPSDNTTNPGSEEPSTSEPATEKPNDGITFDAITIFKEYPLFGVGPVKIAGEFIGDSMFVYVLHNGGLALCALYLLFFGCLAIYMLRKGKHEGLLIIAASFLSCFAAVTFIYFCIVPFLAYAISECENLTLKKKRTAELDEITLLRVLPSCGNDTVNASVNTDGIRELCVYIYSASDNKNNASSNGTTALDIKPGTKLGAVSALTKHLIAAKPSAVNIIGEAAPLAAFCASLAGVPVIACTPTASAADKKRAGHLLRLMLRYADIFIIVKDEEAARSLSGNYKLDRNRIIICDENNTARELAQICRDDACAQK